MKHLSLVHMKNTFFPPSCRRPSPWRPQSCNTSGTWAWSPRSWRRRSWRPPRQSCRGGSASGPSWTGWGWSCPACRLNMHRGRHTAYIGEKNVFSTLKMFFLMTTSTRQISIRLRSDLSKSYFMCKLCIIAHLLSGFYLKIIPIHYSWNSTLSTAKRENFSINVKCIYSMTFVHW